MGKKIIITAGGTSEPIDSVRMITNMATGKLGVTICLELLKSKKSEIDKIYYLCSSNAMMPPRDECIEVIVITGTYDLKNKIEYLLKNNKIDFFIHSMAVSDYTTDYVSTTRMLAINIAENIDNTLNKEELINHIEVLIKNNGNLVKTNSKISSYEDNLIIKLKQTPKIISLIKKISPKTYLVGFKLLNNVTEERLCDIAYELLKKNKCSLVVANDLTKIVYDKHEAILIDENVEKIYAKTKEDIANKLINKIWEV